MLSGIILDRVDSINDLGVIMDSKISYTGHIDGIDVIRLEEVVLRFSVQFSSNFFIHDFLYLVLTIRCLLFKFWFGNLI
jgi:hypothetical protein